MKLHLLLFVLIFLLNNLKAQTLNAEQLIQIVKQYHPIVRQAQIDIEFANANITIAKGAFDPVLSTYITQKTFNGVKYYNETSPQLFIPTWYGIEVYTGLQNLNGTRLDPTETQGRSSYFGVNIPLAKNLVLDKRRAFLQQSKLFNTMSMVEKKVVVNNILIDALQQYWAWVNAYATYKVISNNVAVNQERLQFIKTTVKYGERAALDTTEALAQLQSFQLLQNDKYLEFQNAGIQLNAYLWQANNISYNLPANVVPQDGWENETNINNFNLVLEDLLTMAERNHPELQVYDVKLKILDINKKLKFQELLPKLDFQYNQLSKGFNLFNTIAEGPLFRNNFRYGLKFEMPLRLSKGRGEYKQAKLKIEETQIDVALKRQSILFKVRQYFNEFINLRNQITLQSANYSNYMRLVKGEEIRFLNGESSLFLINARENKALEAQEKLVSLKTKYFKTIYTLQWSAGLLQ